jgi:hypothetical protein
LELEKWAALRQDNKVIELRQLTHSKENNLISQVLMHWTFVQPIVFQGIVWRCSFVLANDLADSQAGQNRSAYCGAPAQDFC